MVYVNVLALLSLSHLTVALDNGLGARPPLAFSTWNYFANGVNEEIVDEISDAIVSTGLAELWMKASGGVTPSINIDAGYLTHERGPKGELVVNKTKFPSGLRALSERLAAKGLGMGVYTDLTNRSCGTGPGSLGHYEEDARQIALEWKAAYLKVDYCGAQYVSPSPGPQLAHWQQLRDALNATGAPVYYSVCPHTKAPDRGPGAQYQNILSYAPPMEWTAQERQGLANSLLVEFVNTLDFWYRPHSYGPSSPPGGIVTNIDSWAALTQGNYSAPGSHNDLDMLQACVFGRGQTPPGAGMTLEEYRAHYSVWAVLGSPLIHSADFRSLAREHPACLAMLLNEEVLAVNQDPGVLPARMALQVTNDSRVRSDTITQQVFARPLARESDGGSIVPSLAVVYLNRGEVEGLSMRATWEQLGLAPGRQVRVRDLWSGKDLGPAQGAWEATVGRHEVRMFRFDGAELDMAQWMQLPRVPSNSQVEGGNKR